MSETEDPAITVQRLLKTNMRVVKEDGTLASIDVIGEWLNNEALKNVDGQVTVGLAETAEQKLDLSGKTRRITPTIRVNVWVTENANINENARSIRRKIVEEINRIIRQNRNTPNLTTYSFVGLGVGGSCRAFSGYYENPPGTNWIELAATDIEKLWYSDNNRYQVLCEGNDGCAALLFGFRIESRINSTEQATFRFEGYGSGPAGNGVIIKIYNQSAGTWQLEQSNQAGNEDEILQLTLNANLIDFLDSQGYIWFLARTASPSDEVSPAILTCDYASCSVTVNGITYCDIAGHRNFERTEFRPIVYRTEMVIKSWLIRNIGD